MRLETLYEIVLLINVSLLIQENREFVYLVVLSRKKNNNFFLLIKMSSPKLHGAPLTLMTKRTDHFLMSWWRPKQSENWTWGNTCLKLSNWIVWLSASPKITWPMQRNDTCNWSLWYSSSLVRLHKSASYVRYQSNFFIRHNFITLVI